MKTLVEYLKESLISESDESKSFTFNFNELSDAKEIMKQLKQIADDGGFDLDETENSLTIKITPELKDSSKITAFRDAIDQYAISLRKDTKNASSESYAQLTKKFKSTVDDMIKFLEEEPPAPAEEPENKDNKTDEE